jgi:hypothetical protein
MAQIKSPPTDMEQRAGRDAGSVFRLKAGLSVVSDPAGRSVLEPALLPVYCGPLIFALL